MKNKKITSLLVAGVLTVGIVGGTLAWLTASDSVTNKFNTKMSGENQVIKVVEVYEEAKNLTPGAEINKDVQVKNVSGVNSFIRVHGLKVMQKGEDGNDVDVTDNFELNYKTDYCWGTSEEDLGKWFRSSDGYFYYIGVVAPEDVTNQILDSFKLPNNADMNKEYYIKVDADSMQASNGAYKDWKDAGEDAKAILSKLDNTDAFDGTEIPGAK
ncbi:BsaA family SipW-dependent biofilm matrix protein [Clostridium cadaveris]|nr:BsaA family SipW-dependent biofilm matrix protein [Clostridium cadaveris]NWK12900.1 hypothetical protein [Clostridium cadaveris]